MDDITANSILLVLQRILAEQTRQAEALERIAEAIGGLSQRY